MKTIKVSVDDATYQRLVRARREAGLPSTAAYLLQRAEELTEDVEAQEIVTQAIPRAAAQTEPFTLKSLFNPTLWGAFSKGARLRAGRMFFTRVSVAQDGIAIGGKTSSGHQLYFVRRLPRRRAA